MTERKDCRDCPDRHPLCQQDCERLAARKEQERAAKKWLKAQTADSAQREWIVRRTM